MVAHRVVHGGTFFYNPVVITEQVMLKLDSLTPLAPLHNPQAISVIRAAQKKLNKNLLTLAVFDTAFFQNLPQHSGYALPESFSHSHDIKRFGFHGLAHQFMMQRFHQLHPRHDSHHGIISFQLGHGCSVTAIRNGKPLDTSMGFTPLEGLVMATRAGDIDPGILIYLLKNGYQLAELEQKLNRHSGLLGLSKSSNDMRELLAREVYDIDAKLAVDMFCYRARKYLGAYMAVLGGADAVLFGGGIGENSPEIRKRICADMHWCGLELEEVRNQQATSVTNETLISSDSSTISVYVIAVNEEAVIAEEARTTFMRYPENLS
jgi:acetate kinase